MLNSGFDGTNLEWSFSRVPRHSLKTLGKYEREGNQWATSLQPQLPQRGRRNSRSAWEYSETLSQR